MPSSWHATACTLPCIVCSSTPESRYRGGNEVGIARLAAARLGRRLGHGRAAETLELALRGPRAAALRPLPQGLAANERHRTPGGRGGQSLGRRDRQDTADALAGDATASDGAAPWHRAARLWRQRALAAIGHA